MRDKFFIAVGLFAGAILVRNLYVMLFDIPEDALQGAIYRILYFHVPSWMVCGAALSASWISSILYLMKRDPRADSFAAATTEIGLVFCAIGLGTGTVWARNQWGMWWTWDARLTSAFIVFLVYSSYLMLRSVVQDPQEKARVAAIVSTFGFLSAIVTYKANVWWRTQHPGPVLSFRTGGGTIDPAMEHMIYLNALPLLMLAIVFLAIRYSQKQNERALYTFRRSVYTSYSS
jgi:heme exporter protein C